jgi:hypothetical protein
MLILALAIPCRMSPARKRNSSSELMPTRQTANPYKKPLEEGHFLRGVNEIHLCRLVFLLESIIWIFGLFRVIITT